MARATLAADLVIVHANIRTMDEDGTVAQALAAKGGRIIAVGETSDITPLAGGSTRRLDAHGRTVLPGFIDGHVHFHDGALANAYLIDYLGLNPRTKGDVLGAISDRAAQTPVGGWIRAQNLNPDHLEAPALPTRRELDEVAPDNPVVVYAIGFHMAAANSRALSLAGIDRATPDPPGGAIERDATGLPSGILSQRGKLRLDPRQADTVLPKFDMNSRLTALRSGIEYLLSHGVTTIHDIVDGPEEVQAYQTLKALGQLRVRVQLLIRGIESQIPVESFVALGLQQGFGDDWLKIGGVKFSIDGIETARNAATYDAYPGQPWNRGIIRIPADELEEKVLLCHRNGVRVAIHAIGPRAVDSALDAIEKALREVPRGDHRHRIEHGYLPGPSSQLPRMARLGVVASPQVSFLYGLGDSWIRVWGVENLTGAMPLQSMLSLGIKVMGSTDYPCVPVDPFLGVKSAVVRRTRNGVVLGEREAINVQEAVRLQTTGAAFGGFEELHKGSLEVGKLADCIVVSQDPWTVPADQLDSIEVMLTVVNGQVEFERSPSVLG